MQQSRGDHSVHILRLIRSGSNSACDKEVSRRGKGNNSAWNKALLLPFYDLPLTEKLMLFDAIKETLYPEGSIE